jgi:benzodiazapine receptor
MTPVIIVAVVVAAGMLLLGGLTTQTGQWYRDLNKPRWTPPNWAFAPAWTVILALAAWAGVLAWSHAATATERLFVLAAYAANVLLHGLWSPLFFRARRPDWALIEIPLLWVSIAALIVAVTPLSTFAGLLLLPYLLWVSFAALLNLAIVRLNPPPRREASVLAD